MIRGILPLIFLLIYATGMAYGLNLNKAIHHAIAKSDLGASYGILIEDTQTHRPLYQQNASRHFIPASNMKLLTAIAALKLLGGQFRFQTLVYIDPKARHNHVLNGNLVFHFSGDPTLTTADITTLVAAIKKAGIHHIVGNVMIDSSAYDGPNTPIGWVKNDLNYCYGAKASSVILNQNCLHVNLLQTKTQRTKLIKYPDSTSFYIKNSVQMVPKKELKKCVFWPEITDKNQIYLKGCLPPKKRYSFSLAINNPVLFAENTIRNALKKAHILLSGAIRSGKQAHEHHLIAKHLSPPLNTLLYTMLQHSNNLYANTITRTLGRQLYGSGSFKAGANAIQSVLLRHARIDFFAARLEDGSGLSRYNLLSPDQLVALIQYALTQPLLAQALAKDLPRSGRSGTLYRRMNSKEMAGKVFAKTGSMHDVSSLSGYLYTKHHHRIVFSMIMNNFVTPLNRIRTLQDNILHLVYLYA